MKEKILAQLKAKFVGVSAAVLGLLADKIAAKVTDEQSIEGAISELEKLPFTVHDLDKFYQQEGDRRATEAANTREAKLKEQFNFTQKDKKPDESTDNETVALIKKLQQEIAEMKENGTSSTFVEKAKLGLKSVPEAFYRDVLGTQKFKSEDDVKAFITKVESNYNEVQQELVDSGLVTSSKKPFGIPGADGVDPAMKNFIEEKTKKDSENPLGAKKI